MVILLISEIKTKIHENKIKWRINATQRLIQRNIKRKDVIHTLLNGEIIEEYPKDLPYPSCLILGHDTNYNPQHVVCSVGQGFLWIITVYKPDIKKWQKDLKTRKG
jgi:hypothetical protein